MAGNEIFGGANNMTQNQKGINVRYVSLSNYYLQNIVHLLPPQSGLDRVKFHAYVQLGGMQINMDVSG